MAVDKYSRLDTLVEHLNAIKDLKVRSDELKRLCTLIPEFKVILDMIFLEDKPFTFKQIQDDPGFRRDERKLDETAHISFSDMVGFFKDYGDQSPIQPRVKLSRIVEDFDWMNKSEYDLLVKIMKGEEVDLGLLNHKLYSITFPQQLGK